MLWSPKSFLRISLPAAEGRAANPRGQTNMKQPLLAGEKKKKKELFMLNFIPNEFFSVEIKYRNSLLLDWKNISNFPDITLGAFQLFNFSELMVSGGYGASSSARDPHNVNVIWHPPPPLCDMECKDIQSYFQANIKDMCFSATNQPVFGCGKVDIRGYLEQTRP